MPIRFLLPVCWGLWLSLTACSPAKKLTRNDISYSREELIAALQHHNYPFEWFHGKGDVKIDGFNQSHHVQSIVRMKADSSIWMVFKKFEVEAIRFLMTPEIYTVLFRLDNTYMKNTTSSIRNQLGIDVPFTDLQNWLFGNIYLPDTEEVDITQTHEIAEIRFSSKGWNITYQLDKNNLHLMTASLRHASQAEITMKFADYKNLPSGENLAYYREINMRSPEGETAEMRLDFSEIEVNVPKELKFVVPSHYSEFE